MSTVETIIARPDTVEEAVSFGVALLDEHVPDWASSIDVEGLILSDAGCCVLGQLFGNYDAGCKLLDIQDETPERCGFNTDADDLTTWTPLQREWERVIRRRQAEAES